MTTQNPTNQNGFMRDIYHTTKNQYIETNEPLIKWPYFFSILTISEDSIDDEYDHFSTIFNPSESSSYLDRHQC